MKIPLAGRLREALDAFVSSFVSGRPLSPVGVSPIFQLPLPPPLSSFLRPLRDKSLEHRRLSHVVKRPFSEKDYGRGRRALRVRGRAPLRPFYTSKVVLNLTRLFLCLFQIGWHQSEHTLSGLHCGREYNAYIILVNALGLASPTSEVLNVRTQV